MNKNGLPAIVPALERATHAVALWVERSFHELRLTQADAHILAYLARHAPCAINDLHRSFGHKRSTLTSVLDRLERRGWLRRGIHPTSRRLVLVHLTDEGRQVGEQVGAALDALEARMRARAGGEAETSFLHVLKLLEEEVSRD